TWVRSSPSMNRFMLPPRRNPLLQCRIYLRLGNLRFYTTSAIRCRQPQSVSRANVVEGLAYDWLPPRIATDRQIGMCPAVWNKLIAEQPVFNDWQQVEFHARW